jgi:uncharacterized membrane protein
MEFFGRLHPILLHLPIGFLLLAWLMELASRQKRWTNLQPAVGFALNLGMLSAIVAAASGYWLSREGGYEENLLFWHQWLGVLTVIFAILVKIFYDKKEHSQRISKFYFPAFTLTIFLLFSAGHFGGSLTHGSDFLTAPFTEKTDTKEIIDLAQANVFLDIVNPIFKQKCVRCHNENKIKGGLLMTTQTGILAGGESGDFMVAGNVAKSLFLQRAHLPLDDKEHMPPKGKIQLTKDEVSLLEWWVSEGANFDKTVEDSEVPEDIQVILDKYATTKDKGIFALKVEKSATKHLQKLENAQFSVHPLALESPFLAIKWQGKNLTASDLNLLKKVQEQVAILDLSNSNLDDDLCKILADLPHLQQLFLQKTKLTSTGLKYLEKHDYLEYLNLYDTRIDDAGLVFLEDLKRLKKLFLWQTQVSEKGVTNLQNSLPKLDINLGTETTISGSSKLKPPTVIAASEIFKDSLKIELQHGFSGIQLYLTLDGSTPDSQSMNYAEPLIVTNTTELHVFAAKDGWENSDTLQKVFTKIDYKPKMVRLSKPPNPSYSADGAASLYDLKKGTTTFAEGNWLGYQGENFTAVLDFGEPIEVGRVTVSALEDTNSYIFFPRGMEIATSIDGVNFQRQKTATYETTNEPKVAELGTFSEVFDPINARFVKVNIKSNLKNPPWHPAPGAPCWVFVDEILVTK